MIRNGLKWYLFIACLCCSVSIRHVRQDSVKEVGFFSTAHYIFTPNRSTHYPSRGLIFSHRKVSWHGFKISNRFQVPVSFLVLRHSDRGVILIFCG